MNNDPKSRKRRPHYANYWRAKWKNKREQMTAHLNALNSAKIIKAQEKVAQVKAFTHMLPQEPMSCTRLRDQVAECWNDVYGENLNSNKAWNIVRLCIKHGLFTKDRLNLYTLTQTTE